MVCCVRQSTSTLTAPAVYARAVCALIMPAGVITLASTGHLGIVAQVASEHTYGKWLGLGLVACLVVLECRWLVTLARLVRAGGRPTVLATLDENPDELARRRRFRFRLVTLALSVLLTFGIAEVLFRALGITPPPPAQLPALDCEEVDNSLNALGLRETWDALPTDDARLRIACLGDSTVYGYSVEPYETFCHLLESLLEDEVPEGVVTINMGYPGTSPGWQLQRYLPLRETLRPDIVVHVAYPNDLGIDMHDLLSDIYRIRDQDLWVGDGSFVLRYAERQIRHWIAWNRTVDYFRGGNSPKERAVAWAKFKADVRACRSAVEEGGAEYALVLFPWLVRLDNYMLADVHATMRDFAGELGVPYLDLFEVFAGRDAGQLRVSLANEHPNPRGHRLAAERIARFLQEQVLPTVHH